MAKREFNNLHSLRYLVRAKINFLNEFYEETYKLPFEKRHQLLQIYIIEYVLNLDNFMQPKYYDRNLNYLNNIKGNFAEKFPSDAVYWSKFNYFIELCIMKIFLCLSFCLCL